MIKFMEISSPVLFSEEYSCRQILRKTGSSSNYLPKLCECRAFLKCNILKIISFSWHRKFAFQYL